MNIFDFFRLSAWKNNKLQSATLAKERLQIVVSHERIKSQDPDFLPNLRQDLLKVITKYVKVDKDQITVALQRNGKHSVLELNIALPSSSTLTEIEPA